MKNIISIIVYVLMLQITSVSAFAFGNKDITNMQWEKSVAKGKKLKKFRETVTSPALGEKAWKITLLPLDCGNDGSNYSDCKNNGKDAVVGHGGGDRARSEYATPNRYRGEKWISVSIYLPEDFKNVHPVSVSFFQIYEWGKTNQQRHPRMMLRVEGDYVKPMYYPINGRNVEGKTLKRLHINDMRGKWTTFIFHTKMGKPEFKGFAKMYVNGVLYNEYNGRTGYGGEFYNKFGIYHSWVSRYLWNRKNYDNYPTQVVYYDTMYRTNKKEKLLKLLKSNGLNITLSDKE